MEYRVLGPLEALGSEGPLPLGGAKQRALLALLLLNANRVVSRERLIDELWGEDPPETAVTSVQVYVSRLRKLLPGGSLVTRPPGYVLEVGAGERRPVPVRAARRGGSRALAAGDPEPQRTRPRGARPLARTGAGGVRRRAVRADRRRPARRPARRRARGADRGRPRARPPRRAHRRARGADRRRIRIASGCGHSSCSRSTASGRQTEALDGVPRTSRATLDEIGIEPGASLQRLERQILNHDPRSTPRACPWSQPPADARPLERSASPSSSPPWERRTSGRGPGADGGALRPAPRRGRSRDRGGRRKGREGSRRRAARDVRSADGEQRDHAPGGSAALATQDRLTRAFGETLSLRMALETGDVILGRPVRSSWARRSRRRRGSSALRSRATSSSATAPAARSRPTSSCASAGSAHVLARAARANRLHARCGRPSPSSSRTWSSGRDWATSSTPRRSACSCPSYFRAMQSVVDAARRHRREVHRRRGHGGLRRSGPPRGRRAARGARRRARCARRSRR